MSQNSLPRKPVNTPLLAEYIERLKAVREEAGEEFSAEEMKNKANLRCNGYLSLISFPFTALQLSANIDEEQVAEVFVRINSKGQTLNQADFILTLTVGILGGWP